MRKYKTVGSRKEGFYFVYEIINGLEVRIGKIRNNHRDGLKDARQLIGRHLISEGIPLDEMVQHQCFTTSYRKNNPKHKWPVSQYLVGVPEKK